MPAPSSPLAPSTPGAGQKRLGKFNESSPLASNPSTTPAGPPPSSVRSFTPAGPPPSSVFGSSQLGSSKLPSQKSPAFSGKGQAGSPIQFGVSSSPLGLSNSHAVFSTNRFALPDSSPVSQRGFENGGDSVAGGQTAGLRDSGAAGQDMGDSSFGAPSSGPVRLQFGISQNEEQRVNGGTTSLSPLALSRYGQTPAKVKTSRTGVANSKSPRKAAKKQSRPSRESPIPMIARSLASQLTWAPVEESDKLILGTEGLLNELHDIDDEVEQDLDLLSATLSNISERLCSLWIKCRDQDQSHIAHLDEVPLGIGPDENAPIAHSAIFLATLLLPTQHPTPAKGRQALAASRLDRSSSLKRLYPGDAPYSPTAYPKMLLEWLDKNHNAYEITIGEVQAKRPSPTAHQNFWDVLLLLTVRGKMATVVQLLKSARFEHAMTAREDGHGTSGYQGERLANVQSVMNRALQVFEACPILTEDDWHVTGNDWILFRKLVDKSLNDLTTFAEGRDRDLDLDEESFEATNFGLGSMSNDMVQTSRRAESRVPWTIFQNLKTLYGILLGGGSEILSSSQDWVEGTMALTAWWGGDDDDEVVVNNTGATRHILRQSRSKGPRLVDQDPKAAYLRRMASAFERVTDESEDTFLLPDSTKPSEIALACVFESDAEGLLGILKGFSLPIANAIAEIATAGGWLQSSSQSNLMDGFDESDLMVLSSFTPEKPPASREDIMAAYAAALFELGRLTTSTSRIVEGWELAIALLARQSPANHDQTKDRIRFYLEKLPLNSDEQIDKVFDICQDYEMTQEGEVIVERYANAILEDSDNYGTALVYYARAHRRKKIKDVLDLLISFSLVQSTAFPAPSALDPNLQSLVFDPETSLKHIAALDEDAADILQTYLSGYAALRRYYDLRDAEVDQAPKRPTAEIVASQDGSAVKFLLAIIGSADDNIYGGLYDESRKAVVQVDGLLALLGEATVFLDQTPSALNLEQCVALLKAIEDLSTVAPRVYNQCEEFLRSTMASKHRRAALSSPRTLLKKQMSSMTSGSGSGAGSFSLVGSSLLLDGGRRPSEADHDGDTQDAEGEGDASNSSSRALIVKPPARGNDDDDVKRGWDWRDGMDPNMTGQDLLMKLRLGLAREIARHWVHGE